MPSYALRTGRRFAQANDRYCCAVLFGQKQSAHRRFAFGWCNTEGPSSENTKCSGTYLKRGRSKGTTSSIFKAAQGFAFDMTIPVEDWIKDTEWREMHLTSHGWIKGTLRTEKGHFEDEIDPPLDRVLTLRILECVPSNPNEKPSDWCEIIWHSRNPATLEAAQEKWGVLPRWAPALSANSAAKYPMLSNLGSMRLSDDKRPRGRRTRGRY
jgi:hypothetical protein